MAIKNYRYQSGWSPLCCFFPSVLENQCISIISGHNFAIESNFVQIVGRADIKDKITLICRGIYLVFLHTELTRTLLKSLLRETDGESWGCVSRLWAIWFPWKLWSHLKGAVAEFVHPGQTVVFESSEHQGSLLRLHAERRHVLLQEAHTQHWKPPPVRAFSLLSVRHSMMIWVMTKSLNLKRWRWPSGRLQRGEAAWPRSATQTVAQPWSSCPYEDGGVSWRQDCYQLQIPHLDKEQSS